MVLESRFRIIKENEKFFVECKSYSAAEYHNKIIELLIELRQLKEWMKQKDEIFSNRLTHMVSENFIDGYDDETIKRIVEDILKEALAIGSAVSKEGDSK